jgi:hypothetical protein
MCHYHINLREEYFIFAFVYALNSNLFSITQKKQIYESQKFVFWLHLYLNF